MSLSPRLEAQLEQLAERAEELQKALASPEIVQDHARFQAFSRELGEIQPILELLQAHEEQRQRWDEARELLLAERDPELRALAEEDQREAEAELARIEESLQVRLLPRDPNDERNVFLEIRAGTGGEEAALFAADLARMYTRYAEGRGFGVTVLSSTESERGGYKEIVLEISGRGAYSRLKFESGGHRVQRVPETESQGRIHTSACTVAVLPEVDAVHEIHIQPSDLRIDTYRASGAGGQHVNKTDSAIRITHLPTGLVVACQEDRSQHKNRARAMALLQARLLEMVREQQESSTAATRRSLIGSGDRSERIRTYNFPQGRITDHRINLTIYRLEAVLAGELDALIDPLIREHQAELLAQSAGLS
ncbi:MAG: peptide chain release factor 1 [Acidithiobacillus sp.]|uniref:peptide chain release factor 1 n=1 Tax=Acidithiobacillus TaxID=119977 RepID=UPI001C07CA61|nr:MULTISPECIES: peptide chain release factor 1 [Acidithiobacillus]MBU2782929.1 peptide chain release factor 1 [Acidithiobacillus caldus]MCE5420013.1 peptide chain release factor 1 [Acidithiobacillus sp.]